jgi:hypothetical protein
VAYIVLWWGNLRERDLLADSGIDMRIILRCWGVDWVKLAHDRDRWWALVNAIMNLQVPKMQGIS